MFCELHYLNGIMSPTTSEWLELLTVDLFTKFYCHLLQAGSFKLTPVITIQSSANIHPSDSEHKPRYHASHVYYSCHHLQVTFHVSG